MAWTASTTFLQVKTEFYASGFDYISDNNQATRAGSWINQSYLELCGLEKWPFLRTSTTGTSPITITDLGEVLRVTDTPNTNRLIESDEDTLADIYPDLTTTGIASWYYKGYSAGSPTINVFPVTTNSLTVIYYKQPVSLSGDADVLVVPDQYIGVVVLGAMRRAYLDGTDTMNQYQMVKSEWQDQINLMRSQLLPEYRYQAIETWPMSSTDW